MKNLNQKGKKRHKGINGEKLEIVNTKREKERERERERKRGKVKWDILTWEGDLPLGNSWPQTSIVCTTLAHSTVGWIVFQLAQAT